MHDYNYTDKLVGQKAREIMTHMEHGTRRRAPFLSVWPVLKLDEVLPWACVEWHGASERIILHL
jgi:hypothetical protein